MDKKTQSGGRNESGGKKVCGRRKMGEEGKVVWVKNPGRVKRVLMWFGCAAFTVAGAMQCGPLTEVVYADEPEVEIPTYLLNQQADFMITKIVPATSAIELKYVRHDTMVNRGEPQYFNAWQGPLSDYELDTLKWAMVEGRQLLFKGFVRANIDEKFKEGKVMPLAGTRMAAGADLSNVYEIDYAVSYSNGEFERVRVSYGRCAKSSVFLSGEATECRLEDRGNGKVQYQPYTSDGVRVEIPADEDALLLAEEDAWRPEPGWPEGYWDPEPVEPEPEPGEPGEPCDLDGSCEEPDEPCDLDDESCESDEPGESDVPGESGEPGEPDVPGESGGDGNMGTDENMDVNVGDADASIDTNTAETTSVNDANVNVNADAGANASANASASADANVNADTASVDNSGANISDGFWQMVAVRNAENYATDGEITEVNDEAGLSNKIVQNNDLDDNFKSDGDDVGVPVLSKESGKWADIWQPMLYILVAMAAIFGWFFLFFGKRKKDNKKGEEKSE